METPVSNVRTARRLMPRRETAAGEPRPEPCPEPIPTPTAETLSPTAATPPGAADPWAPLLTAGMQLLGELAKASSDESESPWVQTDSATGQRYLKLPVPDPQTVQRLAEGLLGLLGGRR
jgi:hypothetical protein